MKKTLLALAALLMLPIVAFAEEDGVTRLHDQTYSVDQTWSGDVLIDGIVQFDAGTTLTILPGTTVRFVKTDTDGDGIGENEIYVQGRLIANGTKDRPIVFTSAEEHPRPGDWGAVNIMVSEGAVNELSNCVIEYGYRGFHMHFSKGRVTDCVMRDNYLGIQCQDSELEVTGCTITHNRGAIVFKDSKLKIRNNLITDNYWAIRFLYGEVELAGNEITGNLINGVTFRENKVKASGNYLSDNRKGFSSEGAEVELDGNIVESNVESGVYLRHSKGELKANEIAGNGDSGISVEDSAVAVTGNDITGNTNFAVDNNGSMELDARGNWWGTTDKSRISAMIYDGSDEAGREGRIRARSRRAAQTGGGGCKMSLPALYRLVVAAALLSAMSAFMCPSAFAHYEGELLPDSVAVMEYQMIINMKPDDTLTRNKLGMVYIRQKKLDKAKEQEILKINESDFDALDSLGIISDMEGKYQDAMRWFARALVVRKDDTGARERYRQAAEKLAAEKHN